MTVSLMAQQRCRRCPQRGAGMARGVAEIATDQSDQTLDHAARYSGCRPSGGDTGAAGAGGPAHDARPNDLSACKLAEKLGHYCEGCMKLFNAYRQYFKSLESGRVLCMACHVRRKKENLLGGARSE